CVLLLSVACANAPKSQAPSPAAPTEESVADEVAPATETEAEVPAAFDPLMLEISSRNVGIFDFSWPATVPETEERFAPYPSLLPEGGTAVDDNNIEVGQVLEVWYERKPYVMLVAFADGDTLTDVIEVKETKQAPYEKNPVSYTSSETALRPAMTYGALKKLGPTTCSSDTVPMYKDIPVCWLNADPGFALSFRDGRELTDTSKSRALLVMSPHAKGVFASITP
ncbi:MAG: hypothetical protein AAF658_09715, partial [Myxococcota bacterium]